jgi:hypothetical protein
MRYHPGMASLVLCRTRAVHLHEGTIARVMQKFCSCGCNPRTDQTGRNNKALSTRVATHGGIPTPPLKASCHQPRFLEINLRSVRFVSEWSFGNRSVEARAGFIAILGYKNFPSVSGGRLNSGVMKRVSQFRCRISGNPVSRLSGSGVQTKICQMATGRIKRVRYEIEEPSDTLAHNPAVKGDCGSSVYPRIAACSSASTSGSTSSAFDQTLTSGPRVQQRQNGSALKRQSSNGSSKRH